jgi:hypothetical protein
MLNMTKYYDEFLRYHEMAKWQNENCNLGLTPYSETPWDDDLIKNVYLYDVVERKYAGFTQLLLDMWYNADNHPYKNKMDSKRKAIIDSFDTSFWSLEEWLFVFFVHRLTGSGINYSLSTSGYHNSILLHFNECDDVSDMVEIIKNHEGPKFTSAGYQIAHFPKPKGKYVRGGDWFMCEILPTLVNWFAEYLQKGKKDFRTLMKWLSKFNSGNGFRVFRFQYAATLADIADFFPDLVNRQSPFFYGTNAIECLKYLAENNGGYAKTDFLDKLMDKICSDTDMVPYNAEDVACDFIRWVENYINPKSDYSHLCLDSVWSSHRIIDHPYGRQKKMLELGLVSTFNGKPHPSDDKILRESGITARQYRNMILEEDL